MSGCSTFWTRFGSRAPATNPESVHARRLTLRSGVATAASVGPVRGAAHAATPLTVVSMHSSASSSGLKGDGGDGAFISATDAPGVAMVASAAQPLASAVAAALKGSEASDPMTIRAARRTASAALIEMTRGSTCVKH